jgi:3-hydroxyacyl-[acyl-carrier-protein] dehydratase
MNKVVTMENNQDQAGSKRTPAEPVVSVERIMQMIPHRYPFLMIDKIIEMVDGEYAVGVKNVSINEQHFLGHFPGKPVMPGVLIIEAMAQTSAVLVVHTLGKEAEGKLVYFMSIDEARFRKPVVPGDSLHIRVDKQQSRRNVWKFACIATVDGVKVADATICAMIVD